MGNQVDLVGFVRLPDDHRVVLQVGSVLLPPLLHDQGCGPNLAHAFPRCQDSVQEGPAPSVLLEATCHGLSLLKRTSHVLHALSGYTRVHQGTVPLIMLQAAATCESLRILLLLRKDFLLPLRFLFFFLPR